MTGERIFQILAVLLAGIAAYFFWQGNTDAMFASAVVGACFFFISIRFQIKERIKRRDAESDEVEEERADSENGSDPNDSGRADAVGNGSASASD